jgi:hypothetical protein
METMFISNNINLEEYTIYRDSESNNLVAVTKQKGNEIFLQQKNSSLDHLSEDEIIQAIPLVYTPSTKTYEMPNTLLVDFKLKSFLPLSIQQQVIQ